MCHSHAFRLLATCLLEGAAIVFFFAPLELAGPPDKTPPERAVYHADSEHLWNRLHEALFVRVGPDGRAYGHDRLEPLLWPGSKHLLEEQSGKRAVALLEEFLKDKGEKLIEDPLKRAMLQRDLWLVFNWLEGGHYYFAEPPLKEEAVRAARERLRRPLAAVIRRLALNPDQIEKLPDSFAAAVASSQFPKQYDPQKPDQAYLPDLFAAKGPWVCLGRPDGPAAPAHLQDGGNAFTNSAFLVFLRLPLGRAATLEYLKQLRSFDQPLLVEAKDAGNRSEKYLPNPKLPQLPKGAEVALVRQALLIDSSHVIRAAPLTESVQLRIYREIPELSTKTLNAALFGSGERSYSWQAVHEFRLSRALLFAGRAGGLRPVGADESDFKTGFGAHPFDAFEGKLQTGQAFPEGNQLPIRAGCFACHSLPGVYSFNSFFNFRSSNWQDGDNRRPFSLLEMPPSEVAAAAVKWKEGRSSWTALRKLLEE